MRDLISGGGALLAVMLAQTTQPAASFVGNCQIIVSVLSGMTALVIAFSKLVSMMKSSVNISPESLTHIANGTLPVPKRTPAAPPVTPSLLLAGLLALAALGGISGCKTITKHGEDFTYTNFGFDTKFEGLTVHKSATSRLDGGIDSTVDVDVKGYNANADKAFDAITALANHLPSTKP